MTYIGFSILCLIIVCCKGFRFPIFLIYNYVAWNEIFIFKYCEITEMIINLHINLSRLQTSKFFCHKFYLLLCVWNFDIFFYNECICHRKTRQRSNLDHICQQGKLFKWIWTFYVACQQTIIILLPHFAVHIVHDSICCTYTHPDGKKFCSSCLACYSGLYNWIQSSLKVYSRHNVSTLLSSVFIRGNVMLQHSFLYTQGMTSSANKLEQCLWP
jgi:hypothetical protein